MKNLFTIATAVFKKSFALMLLSALTIFSRVFSILVFLYRLIADVFALVGFILLAVDCFNTGLTAEDGMAFLTLIAMVALRFALPLLVPVMQHWSESLKDYINAPVYRKTPVRYTI